MNKLIILGVLTLLCWNVIASDIAQLEEKLNTTNDSLRVSILNELCLKYQIRDPVKALTYGFEGIEIAKSLDNRLLEAHLHNSIGKTYIYQSNYPKASEHHLTALRIFQKDNELMGEAMTIFDMAYMYKVFADEYDTAISYYKKAFETFKELKDSTMIVNSLNALGIVYTEAKEYEIGEKYLLQMLETAKNYAFQNFESTSMKQLGWHFYNKRNYEKSQEWYEKAGEYELNRDNEEGYKL